MQSSRFNIRVYGIFLNEKNQVLLSDEDYQGFSFIKFPGGGLEYGEGMIEGLIRECKEEAEMEIEVLEHFYTTDFFQKSVIDDSQIISVYYLAKLKSAHSFPLQSDTGTLNFYSVDDRLTALLPLPIDKVVGVKLYKFVQGLQKIN